MENRISTLAAMLPDEIDAALIISNENRRYFTSFVSSLGYLLITRKQAYLFVDSRYEEAAQKLAKNCITVPFKNLKNSICDIINSEALKSILLEGSAFTLNNARETDELIKPTGASLIKSKKLDEIIGKMRLIKTAEEIEKMRKAQRLTENALSETLKLIKEGISERDIALELEFRMRKAGADGVSFELIVLSGETTSMPHGVPSENKVRCGDFILFDIGATVDGYHSDMTRTYAYGNADASMKRVYDTVLKAQKNGLEAVKSGVSCSEVDKAARDYIAQAGFQGYFGHSTGHGVGLEIHEAPSVSPGNNFILQSGMVITVEPGIYLPGKFGVRIEDMVVVTQDGYINLSAMPKEFIVL